MSEPKDKTDYEALYEEIQAADDYSDNLSGKMTKLIALLYIEVVKLRKENERKNLLLKCARLLLKKISLNDFGTDKECRQAYKKLNSAFEELEKFEEAK